MAATVVVVEAHGGSDGSPTYTNVVGLGNGVANTARYCTNDLADPGTNQPCVIPSSSYYYSYWKHHAIHVVSGLNTSVGNIRWYTDGSESWGTNVVINVGKRDSPGDEGHGCPAANYDKSDGTAGTTGYDLADDSNGHPYYRTQSPEEANAYTFTSGSTLDIQADTNIESNTVKSASVVTQVKIGSTAVQGTKAAETFTFVYDEI